MKKLTLIALALLSAGAAMADGLSREQVVAELQRARNSGELAQLNSENPEAFGRSLSASGPARSREAVLAELQAARASGELERARVESYVPAVASSSTKSRAEVVAELDAARAAGEVNPAHLNKGGYAYLASQRRPASTPRPLLAGQAARSAQ
jgi:Domain of unknown function (DUF4148)